ncbi:MAG: hypothetical protein HW402_475 [Dehalococcoidales bacterium]|nr:hypothetical protein [Dehalococcoidales bacterium]
MWEHIRALEENQLRVSKELALQSMFSARTQVGFMSVLRHQDEAFDSYVSPKLKQAAQELASAQNVTEVVELMRQFCGDCMDFSSSLR